MTEQEQIKAFLENNLLAGRDVSLDDDDDLLLSGLINSLGVMRLVSFVQETFNIEVAPDEVTIENFETINAIANYVKQTQHATS